MRPIFLAALAIVFAAAPALACTGQSVHLEGNFVVGDPGWGPQDERFNVQDAKAVLTPEPGTQTARWDTGLTLTDLDACVTLTMPRDTTDTSRTYAGLLFWLTDKDNFYEAVIAPNGLFTVARKINGKIVAAAPVPWTRTKALKLEPGDKNVLRLTLEGQMVTLRINDEVVARFRGQAPAEPSYVGLVAASAPDATDIWHVSDLKITNVAAADGAEAGAKETISTGAVEPRKGCGSGEVLFADAFQTHDPTWGPKDARLSIDNGEAVLSPVPGTRTLRWNKAFVFDDIDACASVRLAKNTTDSTTSYAGLIFWVEDDRNFYQAVLAPNGYFTVARVVDGEAQEKRPVDWTKVDVAETGAKETNTLRVMTKGNKVTILVNGKEVASFEGEAPVDPSYVGLLAASASSRKGDTWTVSDFRVTAPQ